MIKMLLAEVRLQADGLRDLLHTTAKVRVR